MNAVLDLLKEKTVIVIAHRLHSIIDFDRIITLRGGSIIGQGSFDELIEENAYFQELYNASMI